GGVELVEPVRDGRVVVEVAGALRPPVAIRAMEAPLAVRERAEQEAGRVDGRCEEVGPLEAPSRFGQGRDGHAVPGRDRLVVAERLRTPLAQLEEAGARLVVELSAEDVAAALERLQELLRRPLARRPGEGEPLH